MSRHRNIAVLVQGGRCRRSVWLSKLLLWRGEPTPKWPPNTACRGRGLPAWWPDTADTAFESRRPRTSPTVIPAETVELVVNLRAELSAQGSTPAPTRSPGTSNSATRSPCRHRRSGAVSSIWVSWSPQTHPRNPARRRPQHQSHRNPNRRTPPTPNP